jgi:hypothetical protein
MKHNNNHELARLRPGFMKRPSPRIHYVGDEPQVAWRSRRVRDPLGGLLLNPDDVEDRR